MENILVIDGTNIFHKCHFAYPENLTDAEGNRTGAVYGSIKYLKKLIDLYNPKQLYVCGDVSRTTFRTALFPAYKGTRGKTDDEIKRQWPLFKTFLEAANIPYLEVPNYEADDLIGSLANNSELYGFKSIIASGDRDVFQLITDDIQVVYLSTKGPIIYDRQMLAKKYDGLSPEQFLTLKALMGDAGDNIPGIKGVGEKTGIKLIKDFGSLDGIYENIDSISGKLREKIEAGKEDAYLSLTLATIVKDMPIDYNTIFEIYSEMEFSFDSPELRKFYDSLKIKYPI